MKKLLFLFILGCNVIINAQDHYENKFTLGNASGSKWYKLCTVELAGSYNSVIVSIDFDYVNTSSKYASRAYLRFREGPTVAYSDWQVKNIGVNTAVLKLKKVATKTYELWGYSSGNYGHMSVIATVTKESSSLNFTIPTSPTVVADPNAFDDVAFKGNWHYSNGNLFVNEKLGIGTTSPDSELTVKGKIHAQEVKVDLNGAVAPDYVFKEGYKLKTLEEVQKHIDEHGHLPNIPSAQEMEENGLLLKEMNLKLLEKIEELTLYLLGHQTKLLEKDEELRDLHRLILDYEIRLKKLENTD